MGIHLPGVNGIEATRQILRVQHSVIREGIAPL
jgi:hypothetical protein